MHVLCYVKDQWAYFTSKPLADQWGDDWNDAPYECNAEPPYSDEPGQIVKLAWDGEFVEPFEYKVHSGLSVEQINHGESPWLTPCPFRYPHNNPDALPIPAGTTIDEFRRLITLGGGKVYEATT